MKRQRNDDAARWAARLAGAVVWMGATACGLDLQALDASPRVDERALVLRTSPVENDLDGDGFPDLLVGATGGRSSVLDENGDPISDTGSAYVLRGLSTGVWIAGRLAPPSLEHGDLFGSALATGDWSGDARTDFAIGAPLRRDDAGYDVGAVFVYEHDNLKPVAELRPPLDADGTYETDALFGAALAFGDFDGDGRGDLAVAAPGESNADRAVSAAGRVHVFRSALRRGIPPTYALQRWQELDQTSPGVPGGPSVGDKLGHALATGDFNCDGIDDLAVGVPGWTLREGFGRLTTAHPNTGRVLVFHGSTEGLAFGQELRSEDFGLPGVERAYFGLTLAAASIDGGCEDLAVGAPNLARDGSTRSGVVLLYTQASGALQPSQVLSPVDHGREYDGTAFGAAVVFGDFDGDNDADLAIGAPGHFGKGAVFEYAAQVAHPLVSFSPVAIRTKAAFHLDRTEGDAFGATLASDDYDGDGRDELVVGAPGDLVDAASTGRVYYLDATGAPAALTAIRSTPPSLRIDGERFGVSMQNASRYLRRAQVEVDRIAECFSDADGNLLPFPTSFQWWTGRTFTISTAYYAAAVLLDVVVDPDPAVMPSGSEVSMHEAMELNRDPALLSRGDRWFVHLLVQGEGCSTEEEGLMYDRGVADTNGVPREGAWVRGGGVRLPAHEVGHAFGLHHEEGERLAPDGGRNCPLEPTSYLSCPTLMEGGGTGPYEAQIFGRKSKAHLSNHRDFYVRPGWSQGAPYDPSHATAHHLAGHP